MYLVLYVHYVKAYTHSFLSISTTTKTKYDNDDNVYLAVVSIVEYIDIVDDFLTERKTSLKFFQSYF
jgi:hypothetical protein